MKADTAIVYFISILKLCIKYNFKLVNSNFKNPRVQIREAQPQHGVYAPNLTSKRKIEWHLERSGTWSEKETL